MPKPEQRLPKLAMEPAVGTVGARPFRPLPELRARPVPAAKEVPTRQGEEASGSSEEYATYAEKAVRSMKEEIIAGNRIKLQWWAEQLCRLLVSHPQPSRTRLSSNRSASPPRRRRPQLPCKD